MAITFPLVTLADGALISKTFIDAVVDDINHLTDRPDAYDEGTTTGQTATTATFTQISDPTITITPKRTGYLLLTGQVLISSGTGVYVGCRFDVNGAKTTTITQGTPSTNGMYSHIFARVACTADVAYTVKLEFNNPTASGTVIAVNGGIAAIYGIEVGA